MKNIDYAHVIKAETVRPIKDHVLVEDMDFQERTTKGCVILINDDATTSGIRPRWAKVYSIGPEQKDVKVGEWALVDHARWTRGVLIQKPDGTEQVVRRIDFKDILGVSDKPTNTY